MKSAYSEFGFFGMCIVGIVSVVLALGAFIGFCQGENWDDETYTT